jgi:hypothetical protein
MSGDRRMAELLTLRAELDDCAVKICFEGPAAPMRRRQDR